jgi:hypothetical protein
MSIPRPALTVTYGSTSISLQNVISSSTNIVHLHSFPGIINVGGRPSSFKTFLAKSTFLAETACSRNYYSSRGKICVTPSATSRMQSHRLCQYDPASHTFTREAFGYPKKFSKSPFFRGQRIYCSCPRFDHARTGPSRLRDLSRSDEIGQSGQHSLRRTRKLFLSSQWTELWPRRPPFLLYSATLVRWLSHVRGLLHPNRPCTSTAPHSIDQRVCLSPFVRS